MHKDAISVPDIGAGYTLRMKVFGDTVTVRPDHALASQ